MQCMHGTSNKISDLWIANQTTEDGDYLLSKRNKQQILNKNQKTTKGKVVD